MLIQKIKRIVLILITIALINPLFLSARDVSDSENAHYEFKFRYPALEAVQQPFKPNDSFFRDFGVLVSRYIDENCNSYNSKISRNLRDLGTTACGEYSFMIQESDIGMASLHALKSIVKRIYGSESVGGEKFDLIPSKAFDMKVLVSLKDIRPIFSCKFQLFNRLKFQTIASPVEGRTLSKLEIPINNHFNISLDNRLMIASFHLRNVVFCKGTITF